MMRALAFVGLLGIGMGVSGCTSYVKTYDAQGTLLAACKSGMTLFDLPLFGWPPGCHGSANPKDQKQSRAGE